MIPTHALPEHRPDCPNLVCASPEIGADYGRQTRACYDKLFRFAHERLWVSTFVIHNPAGIFDSLARRTDAMPRMAVTLLLTIERRHGGTSEACAIATRFATDFKRNWPGTRRPDIYYDPRSVDTGDGPGAVLHAKAVVHDNEQVLVTSANLTPNALDRNIEAGVLIRYRPPRPVPRVALPTAHRYVAGRAGAFGGLGVVSHDVVDWEARREMGVRPSMQRCGRLLF